MLDGMNFEWTTFFEEFARDSYLKGPEFRQRVASGTYEVRVWSSNNDSAYSLAVGEIESFGFSEIIRAYVTIPQIKSFFFHKPAYSAFLTPFLGAPIALSFALLIGVGIWISRRRRRG